MFDFVKSSFDTVSQRFSNPLIGAYVMAWLALNHKGVGMFLFAPNNAARRDIIEQYQVGIDEVVAVVLALAYLCVSYLLSPWVQSKIEAFRYRWVEKADIDAKRAEQYHRSLAKYQSSEKYIESKTAEKLAQLEEKTKQFLERTKHTDTEIQSTKADLEACRKEEARLRALYESEHQEVLFYKGKCAMLFESIVAIEEIHRQVMTANDSNASMAYQDIRALKERARRVENRLNEAGFQNNLRALGVRMAEDPQVNVAVPSKWFEMNKPDGELASLETP